MDNGIMVIGKTLILIGVMAIALGVIFMFGSKIPWIGKLPGDIYVQKGGFSLFFPLTTSIVISLVISIVLVLIKKI